MQDNIIISEEDIFKFVFNPKSLAKDKFDYLTKNEGRFKYELSQCLELKNSISTSEEEALIKLIQQKINSPEVIILYPQQINQNTEVIGLRLSAASVLKEVKPNSVSFTDPESKYLIRIVKTNTQSLLYCFSEKKTPKHVKIHFHPSNAEYSIDDFSNPIVILEEENIESISIY